MVRRDRQPDRPHAIVIDTDPGIDDVVTLALAARSPEVELVAVTTTYGNTTLEAATRNARTVLALAGRPDVPLFPGASHPRVRPLVTAPETHGATGVGYAHVPSPLPGDGHAHDDVLLEVLEGVERPVTLVTLGPLTNLSHALDRDRGLVRDRVKRHIGMFGNINERGNTNRWADFNAWCDPEAVQRVLAENLGTQMVGLDVTRRMVMSSTEVGKLAVAADKLVHWLGQALRFYVEFHQGQERLDGCVVNDPLTVGELLDPGLLVFAPHTLTVGLDDGEHRGHTSVCDGGVPVAVATTVDVQRMRRLLDRVFGARWDAA